MARSMLATSSGSVSRRVWTRISPFSSTTPAAIFVPPMSTPMACMSRPLLARFR
ncbi:Uncharacterised protein [Mycobacteroides abscessus]|nr:Uncharacterised protein [Mycobacteroides abscessus]